MTVARYLLCRYNNSNTATSNSSWKCDPTGWKDRKNQVGRYLWTSWSGTSHHRRHCVGSHCKWHLGDTVSKKGGSVTLHLQSCRYWRHFHRHAQQTADKQSTYITPTSPLLSPTQYPGTREDVVLFNIHSIRLASYLQIHFRLNATASIVGCEDHLKVLYPWLDKKNGRLSEIFG